MYNARIVSLPLSIMLFMFAKSDKEYLYSNRNAELQASF